MSIREVFDEIYKENFWVDKKGQPVSGPGSTPEQVSGLVSDLPQILKKLGINSFLDIPCGDFTWMQLLPWDAIAYTGADIVVELVARNRELNGSLPGVSFIEADLTAGLLPKADLVFCRDCLVHLSFVDIFSALANIRKSGATYLAATTFTEETFNRDIHTGGWRPLNFQLAPFFFPKPVHLLVEGCTEMDGLFKDKSMGIWEVASLSFENTGSAHF